MDALRRAVVTLYDQSFHSLCHLLGATNSSRQTGRCGCALVPYIVGPKFRTATVLIITVFAAKARLPGRMARSKRRRAQEEEEEEELELPPSDADELEEFGADHQQHEEEDVAAAAAAGPSSKRLQSEWV